MIHSKKALLALGGTLIFLTLGVAAATSTAWYKVINVQQITQLIDVSCIDNENRPCPRNKYWRVYYEATSQYSPVQTFEKKMDLNPPQVDAVMQMTVNVPSKEMMM